MRRLKISHMIEDAITMFQADAQGVKSISLVTSRTRPISTSG